MSMHLKKIKSEIGTLTHHSYIGICCIISSTNCTVQCMHNNKYEKENYIKPIWWECKDYKQHSIFSFTLHKLYVRMLIAGKFKSRDPN